MAGYLAPPPNGSDTNSFEYQDWLYKTRQQASSGGGGGGSGVTSVSAGTNITITGTSSNPIINATGTGTVTGLSGDVSGAGTGVINTTLATVNSTPGGTYNNFTVNAKGLVTASSFQEYVPVFGVQQAITPASDPFFSSVVLLYHFDDAANTIAPFDSSSYFHQSTSTGTGPGFSVQTSIKKFGSGSWNSTLVTSGSNLAPVIQGSEFAMGTGDFTAEGWFYTPNASVSYFIMRAGSGVSSNTWALRTNGNKIAFSVGGSVVLTGTTVIATNTWTHLAASRVSGRTYLFVNGNLEGNVADANNYTLTTFDVFQGGGSGLTGFTGYSDDIRVTKGVGRYNATFTAPTAPFSNDVYPIGGPRMMDDYSNTLYSNRYIFQTTISNGLTDVGACPNGSSTTASYTVYNKADVNNASYLQFSSNAAISEIKSFGYGSAGPLPISIKIGSTEIASVATTGWTATNITTPGLATLNNLSVGTAAQFVVGNTGNITKINNVVTSWPTSNTTGVLTNNGSGTLTWVATGTITKSTIRSVSASTTLLATDSTLIVDTTSAALVVTLPTPSTVTGQTFVIKNFPAVAANVHNLTISGFTIDYTPSGSFVLSSAGSSVAIQSNGTIYLTV